MFDNYIHMLKRTFILIVVAVAIGLGMVMHSSYVAKSWDDANFAYRKQITIDNDNMDSALTYFPLYVLINADTDIGDVVQADCDDIRFYDLDGTELAHEFEDYSFSGDSPNALTAYIWVKVPSLNSDTDTGTDDNIWLYYGNDSETTKPTASNVWNGDPGDATDNYVGVWHLHETSGTHDDASNGSDGTWITNGGTGTQDAAGKIGGADFFDGNGDYINVADGDDLDFEGSTEDFTVSTWINPQDVTSHQGIVYKGDSDNDFWR